MDKGSYLKPREGGTMPSLILFHKSKGLEMKRQLLGPRLQETWLLESLPESLLEHKVVKANLGKVKSCGAMLLDPNIEVLNSSKKKLKA